MNDSSNRLRVQPKVKWTRSAVEIPELALGTVLSRITRIDPDFPTSSRPNFQPTADSISVPELMFTASCGWFIVQNEVGPVRSLFPAHCGRQPPGMVISSQLRRIREFTGHLLGETLLMYVYVSGNRSVASSSAASWKEFAAVGCKNTRSRLERRPQLAGTDNPQSSGKESAVGWQLARTGLEKKSGYLPSV